jgi:hypothetical protein
MRIPFINTFFITIVEAARATAGGLLAPFVGASSYIIRGAYDPFIYFNF